LSDSADHLGVAVVEVIVHDGSPIDGLIYLCVKCCTAQKTSIDRLIFCTSMSKQLLTAANMIDLFKCDQILKWICTPKYLVGSSSYGVIVYHRPDCDVTVTKKAMTVPMGTTVYKFGRKFKHGLKYTDTEIEHAQWLVIRSQLDSYGVNRGSWVGMVHTAWAGSLGDLQTPHSVESTGDMQGLQECHTYLALMHSLDCEQTIA
jgi:hypothetical protein